MAALKLFWLTFRTSCPLTLTQPAYAAWKIQCSRLENGGMVSNVILQVFPAGCKSFFTLTLLSSSENSCEIRLKAMEILHKVGRLLIGILRISKSNQKGHIYIYN